LINCLTLAVTVLQMVSGILDAVTQVSHTCYPVTPTLLTVTSSDPLSTSKCMVLRCGGGLWRSRPIFRAFLPYRLFPQFCRSREYSLGPFRPRNPLVLPFQPPHTPLPPLFLPSTLKPILSLLTLILSEHPHPWSHPVARLMSCQALRSMLVVPMARFYS
jgi:hypothetical protein